MLMGLKLGGALLLLGACPCAVHREHIAQPAPTPHTPGNPGQGGQVSAWEDQPGNQSQVSGGMLGLHRGQNTISESCCHIPHTTPSLQLPG
jgi:hypothetical protein